MKMYAYTLDPFKPNKKAVKCFYYYMYPIGYRIVQSAIA